MRGYEYYVNVTRTSEARHHWILADDINNRLLPWLQEHASEDFFVFAHYWDPHKPYNAPEPYDSMYLDSEVRVKKAKSGESYVECAGPLADLKDPERANLARYDGEINYLDNRLGQVLEALESYGIADETAIIIVGDHGEIMVERDVHFDHRGVWNFNVRVPLILYSPTLAPQVRRSDSYVHHVDLFPTVLDLLGLSRGRARRFFPGTSDHQRAGPDSALPVWRRSLSRRTTALHPGRLLEANQELHRIRRGQPSRGPGKDILDRGPTIGTIRPRN